MQKIEKCVKYDIFAVTYVFAMASIKDFKDDDVVGHCRCKFIPNKVFLIGATVTDFAFAILKRDMDIDTSSKRM